MFKKVYHAVTRVMSGVALGVGAIVGGLYGFNLETIGLMVLAVVAIGVSTFVEYQHSQYDYDCDDAE